MRDITHPFQLSGVVVTSQKDRKCRWAFGGIELVAYVGNGSRSGLTE